MKKMLLSFCLLLAFTYVQAAFVPTEGLAYYVTQTSSSLIIGATGSSVVLQTASNNPSQVFTFIPVSGKTDTYYIKNREGNYLNKVSTSWDGWSVIFQNSINGLYSEWVIAGTDAGSLRLMNNFTLKYLASDAITSGTAFYGDKNIDNANGLFSLVIAPAPAVTFVILEKNVVLEVEKEIRAYPLYIKGLFFTDDITVSTSTGFSTVKNTYTPADFTSGSGIVKIEINTTAAVGDTGKVIFSYTHLGITTKLDSVRITVVSTYARHTIRQVISNLVIGNNGDASGPALTANLNDISQKFILRPVNPKLNDSIYYILQDGEYRMLRKNVANSWDTEFGNSGNEAKWTVKRQPNGNYSITNFVTTKVLGADAIIAGSPLYDDKTYVAGGNHEWMIVTDLSTGVSENISEKIFATITAQTVNIHGASAGDIVKVFNVNGQLIRQLTANSSVTSIHLKSGIYIVSVNDTVVKVMI